ncbi:MAG: hypothetical protein CMH56_04565 [Myxococcales bacterium]|nr:hypothetical protein [Myxococcales bacterium]|tara:strand:+ start:142 stop:402 length:261 start_codon:yes stop_codon:yes gene_type:complete
MTLANQRFKKIFLIFSTLSFFGLLGVAGPAQAKGKRITLEELVIEGNIQKPEAFFILPRAALNFDELQRRENLKERIIESVKKKPF